MRAMIVDDEPLAREAVRMALAKHPDISIAGEAPNIREALETIRDQKPELMFLDIRMPEGGGMELLRELEAEGIGMPSVIFVTAYTKHAIEAFERHAVDYLLKPFSQSRFDQALERAMRRVHMQKTERMMELSHMLNEFGGRGTPERIAIKTKGRVVFADLRDVQWVEAQRNYVLMHCRGSSYIVRERLATVEERLQNRSFVRIHRSVIVNVRYVKEIKPWFTGEYILTMADGKEFTVSRTYKESLGKIADINIGTELGGGSSSAAS